MNYHYLKNLRATGASYSSYKPLLNASYSSYKANFKTGH